MSIVIDLNMVCLVCCSAAEDGLEFMHSIYEADEQTPQLTITDKIARCSELRLQGEHLTKLPDKICSSCLSDLAIAWRFRSNCEQAAAVFASIQQQEEEADLQASRELEQQKIRLPSGLKIKRIQPETKTYLLPVQMEESEMSPEEEAMLTMEVSGITTTVVAMQQVQENEDTEEDAVVESEAEGESSGIEEEQYVDFDDEYYKTVEMLDENKAHMHKLETVNALTPQKSKSNTDNDEEDVELQTEIKLERQDEEEDLQKSEEENIQHVEYIIEDQFQSRRARGRPRKVIKEEGEVIEMLPPIPMKYEKENLKAMPTLTTKRGRVSSSDIQALKKQPPPPPLHCKKTPAATRKQCKSNSADSIATGSVRPAKICEICGNSYKYQHALNAHMRRHTNTRPFNCEFCDKAFVSGVELRRHMRVHTGHKPYSCQFCERRFSDFGSRIKHERTHTGERPYKCSTCSKSFAYAHVLSVHVRTHTGEKKFQCMRCGKGFTKKVYLASHMQQQHMRLPTVATAKTERDDDDEDFEEAADSYRQRQHQHQQQQQQPADGREMMAIETVAMEECIFTTKYVYKEGDQRLKSEHEDQNDEDVAESYEIAEVEEECGGSVDMSEEHLVDEGHEIITIMR